MKFGKLFGWGIVIYAIMYLLVAMLSLYGYYPNTLSRIIALLTLIILATIAGASLKFHLKKDILLYSFVWVLEIAALDALMSVPYAGWGLYLDWNIWVGYALVLVVPLFSSYLHRHSSTTAL